MLGLADEDARGIVGDGVVGEQLGDVLPHSLVDVVAVGALQLLDRADVLRRGELLLEVIEALHAPRPTSAVRGPAGVRSAACRATARGTAEHKIAKAAAARATPNRYPTNPPASVSRSHHELRSAGATVSRSIGT